MINLYTDSESPQRFLNYWNDHPILWGGDRFSLSPGFTIHYLQHTDADTFEIKLLPVEAGRSEMMEAFLVNVVGLEDCRQGIEINIREGVTLLATAELRVDHQYRYVLGEGIWHHHQGHPSQWAIDCRLS